MTLSLIMVTIEEKTHLINKARNLAAETFSTWLGCAQTTLLAVAETLEMEVTDDVFNAVIPLSSFSGGCGGICGGAAAFGLRYGKGKEAFLKDPALGEMIDLMLRFQDRFDEKYTGFLCRDIQRNLYGESYDFRIPEERAAFDKNVDHIYDTCAGVVADSAGWVVEAILEKEHPELPT